MRDPKSCFMLGELTRAWPAVGGLERAGLSTTWEVQEPAL